MELGKSLLSHAHCCLWSSTPKEFTMPRCSPIQSMTCVAVWSEPHNPEPSLSSSSISLNVGPTTPSQGPFALTSHSILVCGGWVDRTPFLLFACLLLFLLFSKPSLPQALIFKAQWILLRKAIHYLASCCFQRGRGRWTYTVLSGAFFCPGTSGQKPAFSASSLGDFSLVLNSSYPPPDHETP